MIQLKLKMKMNLYLTLSRYQKIWPNLQRDCPNQTILAWETPMIY